MNKQEKVYIDFEACKECGYCKTVCPKNVFAKGSSFNNKGYRAYETVSPEACIGCLRCFYACPDFAVTVHKGGAADEKSV